MNELIDQMHDFSLPEKLGVFVALAVCTHVIVIVIRHIAHRAMAKGRGRQYQKLRSIGTLATSALVFTLYFFAVGLILREFGLSLTAYLASASVVGLAIGFGSQGVVQDVVTGLTFIFSDLVDVGDLVEISGQTGIVQAITMRFVVLENALGATVSVPNRTINNVVGYPRGYVRCIVDITLRGDESQRMSTESAAIRLMHTIYEQFPAILIAAPTSEGRLKFDAGKEILRLKFRIWPTRGQAIETAYNEELVAELTSIDPDYKSWMVTISYEVEKRAEIPQKGWSWRR